LCPGYVRPRWAARKLDPARTDAEIGLTLGRTKMVGSLKRLLTGLSALAFVACSPKAEEAAAPAEPAKPVAAVKLIAMDCGHLSVKDAARMSDDGVYNGQKKELADPCYLIRHEKGDLIWDTGLPSSVAAAPVETATSTVTLAKTLEAQLAELSLTPADIEYLSFSHLHYDHTGNGNLFAANSTGIVDKDERDAMFTDEARKTDNFKAYSALETAKTTLIEGDADYDVFGDGSALIVQAPGHRRAIPCCCSGRPARATSC
jgi:hypothetical protein